MTNEANQSASARTARIERAGVQNVSHAAQLATRLALAALAISLTFASANRADAQQQQGTADARESAAALLTTGGVALALSLPALGAVTSQIPTFGDRVPEWAMATLGASAILGPFGVLALGAGVDFARGGNGEDGLVAAAIADVLIGILLSSLAVALAPGVGATWSSGEEQARASELLGVEAIAFVFTGSIALTAGLFLRSEPR